MSRLLKSKIFASLSFDPEAVKYRTVESFSGLDGCWAGYAMATEIPWCLVAQTNCTYLDHVGYI